jgi:predicted permease
MPARRWFQRLLKLYPAAFRSEYERDLMLAFDTACEESRAAGEPRWRFGLGLARDFVATVPRVWWTHVIRPRRRVGTRSNKESQLMQNLLKDIRFAIRGLVRKPGLAITAVMALALGIGLTTAMFSIVNGIILKGLPVEQPQEIMAINRINPAEGQNRLAGRYHDYLDLAERQTTFEGIGAMWFSPANVSPPDGNPEFVTAASISANTFGLLGVQPVLGRDFGGGDEVLGAPPVVLVGHQFWETRLKGDRSILGKTIRVNGDLATVIGIMPENFEFPANQELWLPLRANALELPRGQGPLVLTFGRLKDGVQLNQAQVDLAQIMTQLGQEYPDTNEGMSVVVGPYVNELIGYQITPLLFTMLGAVSLVLLIACANVANLLLARASLRSKEVAIRTAMGASRRRVIAQLLVESTVIAIAGAAVGIGLAQIGVGLFNGALQQVPQGLPFWFAIAIDPRVLLFVLMLTVVASLLSGVIPALRASGADVNAILKDETRGTSSLRIGRLSRGLVVMEVAFSCALLVAAGLMVKSVTNLSNLEFDFATEDLFTSLITLPEADYPDAESRVRFYRDAVGRLAGQPGVLAAAVSTDLPVIGFGNGRIALEKDTYQSDADYPSARIGSVTPQFFGTIEASVMEGRDFTDLDTEESLPVAIVNTSFVTKFFPGESPLGQRLTLRGTLQQAAGDREGDKLYTIVGVAPDLYLEGDLFVLGPEAVYFPMAQRPEATASLVLRTQGDPLAHTATVRSLIAEMDSDLPLSQVNTLAESIRQGQFFFGIFGTMFTVFGGVALFLATVGLYGVLSFTVNQRTHEVGLRVALGASPGRVVRQVMRQGMIQLGLGIAIGAVIAVALGRGISVILFDVAATDVTVFLSIVGVLTVTGFVACLLPARRATRVDPMVAMRAE